MNQNDQNDLVQKIRTQYTEKEFTQLDALKALDARVKRPVNTFAWIFGSLGAIILGAGMSLIMTDISETIGMENPMVSGIVIGVIGMTLTIVNYPVYKRMLTARRKKYAAEIISLSDSIRNG